MRTLIIGAAVLGVASIATAGQRVRDVGDHAYMLQLAHELEATAASVHHRAEGTAHHPSRGERQALRRLHELNKEARHFHRQAERYRPSRRHLHDDFGKLVQRLWRAESAMHDLHALRPVRRDLRRIAYLMDEISAVGRFGRGWGRGHARDIYTDRRRYSR